MTIPYPRIPPEIFRVGPVALRWYGVMYVVGYVVGVDRIGAGASLRNEGADIVVSDLTELLEQK